MTRTHAFRTAALSSARVSLTAIGMAVIGGAAVRAQTGAAIASPQAATIEEVVVTAKTNFLSVDTSGTTGLPLQVERVPQSISLVTNDFLNVANLRTLGQVADYTPGAVDAGAHEGFGSILRLRGFAAGQSVDGLNVTPSLFNPDTATIDRLEIVKGPSSVVYGVSSPGGLVNIVTKSALRDTPSYLTVQGGSYDTYRFEGQVAAPLDSAGRFRAIGVAVYEQGDSFQDFMNHQSVALYGGLNAELTPDITAYVHGGYERQTRVSFDGIPTEADGSPAPVSRSFFIGTKDDRLTTDVYHVNGAVTWRPTQLLELSVKSQYQRADTRGVSPYAYGLQPDGTLSLNVDTYEPQIVTDFGVGVSALYALDQLHLEDSFVTVSALYQESEFNSSQGQATFDGQPTGTANIYDGDQAISQLFSAAPSTPNAYFEDNRTKTLTLSGQAVIQPIAHLSLLFGASYSDPKIDNSLNGADQKLEPGGRISYRAGATYEFLAGANVYFSFSQSFLPQSDIDVNGHVLPPLIGEEYEAGIKYRALRNKLLLTGAVFRITQQNQAEFAQTIDGYDRFQAVGEVRHQGVELQALGRITSDWQVNAGYAYLDPKVISDNDPTLVGQTETFLPKQTGSVFTTYTFPGGLLKGVSIGGGVRYVGSERTAYDGSSKPLRAYTVADAVLAYAFRKWQLQLNIINLFDKSYFVNNYQTLFYGNAIGAPRSAQVSLRRTF